MEGKLNVGKFWKTVKELKNKNGPSVGLGGTKRIGGKGDEVFKLGFLYAKSGNTMDGHKPYETQGELAKFVEKSRPGEGTVTILAQAFDSAGKVRLNKKDHILGEIDLSKLVDQPKEKPAPKPKKAPAKKPKASKPAAEAPKEIQKKEASDGRPEA